MKSAVIKRSVVIAGHKTSVSLEQPFWDVVLAVAGAERSTVSAVLRRIDAERMQPNLSSAVRLFALAQVRARAATLAPPLETRAGAAPAWRESAETGAL